MNNVIDNGRCFDWGKASHDYAKYRDIYPEQMYSEFYELGVGVKGENCLDIGTGTGIIPINMYKLGAHFTGMDIASEQIEMARQIAEDKGFDIDYVVGNSEKLPFDDNSFNSVSAVQCWRYFDKDVILPEIYRVLKTGGILLVACMQWLPAEDEIIMKSHDLVRKYNPQWNPNNERLSIEKSFYFNGFKKKEFISMDVSIEFTYDTWNGRMKACRGIEASLSEDEVKSFSKEHLEMLKRETADNFKLKHQIVIFSFTKE